ncbi:MAG: glycosyltransferase family 2 protein [Gaiellaceae bacterium]
MTGPAVSVVVPTRDRFAMLTESGLPSAARQVGVDVEVIVVDDGSDQETASRLQALTDDSVRVLRHDRPRGVAAARNTGIAAARADWIAFLDDDDLWSPHKLATQLDALALAGASFAYCGVVVLDDHGTPTEIMTPPRPADVRAELLRRNSLPAGSSNVLAETRLVREVGGFDERLSYLADWDLWLKLAFSGVPASCDDVLVGYVRHTRRMHIGGRAASAELERLRETHGAAGFRPDHGRLLGWLAAEHRRAGRRSRALGVYACAALAGRDLRPLPRMAATLVDWRGDGLRQLVSRRTTGDPGLARPDWLDGR